MAIILYSIYIIFNINIILSLKYVSYKEYVCSVKSGPITQVLKLKVTMMNPLSFMEFDNRIKFKNYPYTMFYIGG